MNAAKGGFARYRKDKDMGTNTVQACWMRTARISTRWNDQPGGAIHRGDAEPDPAANQYFSQENLERTDNIVFINE